MNPISGIRSTIADITLSPLRVGSTGQFRYDVPKGDPGWFGPDSAMWHVCTDWPSMLVGGFRGLILGTLHPLVLAGTLDHSNFQDDPIGRLARTGAFVAATAYGSSADAQRAVDQVKSVHRSVVGIAPNGEPYRAQDPELLLWTHMTVYSGFLEGHLRYHPKPISDVDRYWDEVAIVAEKLGAEDVPRSRAEADAYFERVHPELEGTEDAIESSRWIINAYRGDTPALRDSTTAMVAASRALLPRRVRDLTVLRAVERASLVPAATLATRFAYGVMVRAAIGLLPDWGREMLRLRRPRAVETAVVRLAAATLFTGLRVTAGTYSRELSQARVRANGAA
jgi:uncharacterized protein (DUF2236 family)